jgi:decaprenyl-phosphate phosphoribosyltransferase
MLRYALLLEQGQGGAPEEIFLHNRVLQGLGLVWAALFAAGIYG